MSAHRPLKTNDEKAGGMVVGDLRTSAGRITVPYSDSSCFGFRCCRFHSTAFATHPAMSTVLAASSTSHWWS